jgi:hypothetical protein
VAKSKARTLVGKNPVSLAIPADGWSLRGHLSRESVEGKSAAFFGIQRTTRSMREELDPL